MKALMSSSRESYSHNETSVDVQTTFHTVYRSLACADAHMHCIKPVNVMRLCILVSHILACGSWHLIIYRRRHQATLIVTQGQCDGSSTTNVMHCTARGYTPRHPHYTAYGHASPCTLHCSWLHTSPSTLHGLWLHASPCTCNVHGYTSTHAHWTALGDTPCHVNCTVRGYLPRHAHCTTRGYTPHHAQCTMYKIIFGKGIFLEHIMNPFCYLTMSWTSITYVFAIVIYGSYL